MPNVKSAAKRVRVIQKRTQRNRMYKSMIRTAIRRFEEALANANREESLLKLRRALSIIDKAASKGVIHKNKAARKKSRLAKKFNQAAEKFNQAAG